MGSEDKSIELEYYIKEGISPVHYNLTDINKHFQIRCSLYRLLGLVPSLIKGKDILEIAPGSGHNSIYTASLLPNTYDLVEPNPSGCKDIIKIFKNLSIKHTNPNLFEQPLDDFETTNLYDIVITEGWPGGFLEYDKSMLKKMSSFVKVGGLLLISFFPPIGGLPTYLRRLLAYRLISDEKSIEEKTYTLKSAFSSHLKNLLSMGRSQEHWIQDSLLNPYICVAHNTPLLCEEILDKNFKIYNSVPKFCNDWRWYKSLHGHQRNFNDHFISEYNSISHCMIDYKMNVSIREKEKNINLENLCFKFASVTKNNELLGYDAYIQNVQPLLLNIIDNLKNDLDVNTLKGLTEVDNLLKQKKFQISDISNMFYFSSLFGREQCYLSFTNE